MNYRSVLLLTCIFNLLWAQDSLQTYQYDKDIVVTATRIPTAFIDIGRAIKIIEKKEIAALPVKSVPEVLEYFSGIDSRTRGPEGIQSDVSIRGAFYEQTLVLLDGVKLSDPQTAHHSMNLPVSLNEIERIEILQGAGSRLYGPNAFGGVINIITRKEEKPSANMKISYGDFDLYNTNFNINLVSENSKNHFSISKSASDGYRFNTDFENLVLTNYLTYDWKNIRFFNRLGYNDKQFGASNFYTVDFPEQYEETRLFYSNAGAVVNFSKLKLTSTLFYRRHKDRFLLKRNDPVFYENIHKTDSYGAEVNTHYSSTLGISAAGITVGRDQIDSNNLGKHKRDNVGLYLQQQFFINKFSVSAGLSTFYYSQWDWQSWPGVDVSYKFSDFFKIYGSYSKGFRIPTYTELYYSDPGNRGNENLESEEAENYESGLNILAGNYQFDLALFSNKTFNRIDWLEANDGIFYANNLSSLTIRGLEFSARYYFSFLPWLNNINVNYTYLDADLNSNKLTTRYTLTHFRHKFVSSVQFNIFAPELSQVLIMRYEDRLETDSYYIFDTQVAWRDGVYGFFLNITNIFDKSYNDFPGVPMPGRWFKIGFEYKLY